VKRCSSGSCGFGRFLLTKPNTSCPIEVPVSVRSDGVRDHPGMPFGIMPDLVFGFTCIPILDHCEQSLLSEADVICEMHTFLGTLK
jgi:hypothetical protein